MNEAAPQRSTLTQLTAAAVGGMSEDAIIVAMQHTCVLVRVTNKAFGLSQTDKSSSAEMNKAKNAAPDAGRVVVKKLPGADMLHKAIVAHQAATAEYIKSRTMPCYGEGNWRILPNPGIEPLVVGLNDYNAKFKELREELDRSADTILGAAHANKGNYNVTIPTREELVGAYSMEVQFKPIPDASNFKHLPDVVAQKLSRHLNRHLVQAIEESQRDTLHRFIEPLNKFIERMQAYDKRLKVIANGDDPGKHGIFRDSAVQNIKELHDVLDSFNIAGDERLTQLSQMLDNLANTDPEELRKSDSLREQAMKRAESTLANLDKWLNPLPPGVNP